MINQPRQKLDYADREIDCQEAMEAGFQAIVNCMLEAGWQRSEVMRSLRRLIAADKTPRSRPSLAIARAMIRSGKAL